MGSNSVQPAERNRLLRSLAPDLHTSLLPLLEDVDITAGQVLWHADKPLHAVYFPRTAVCSILTPVAGDEPVEAATVGYEGMMGVPVILGGASTHSEGIGQVAGTAARADAVRFREWLGNADGGMASFLRYTQMLLEQTAQSVACNRKHTLEERCARWLLATRDRVGTDTFILTQQFLAAMLGVRRAGVTVAAGILQKAGLLTYTRGRITILDAKRLEDASCECYGVVRRLNDDLFRADVAD